MSLDDAFDAPSRAGAFEAAAGDDWLTVEFLGGYSYAQVFAPAGQEFICFEPMTAPTNALNSGDGLTVLGPGESYRAAFRIALSRRRLMAWPACASRAVNSRRTSIAPARNAELASEAIAGAVAAGAQIVVLPELVNSGYVFASLEEARAAAVPADGELLAGWAREAARGDAVVVGGFCERAPATAGFTTAARSSTATGSARCTESCTCGGRSLAGSFPATSRPRWSRLATAGSGSGSATTSSSPS